MAPISNARNHDREQLIQNARSADATRLVSSAVQVNKVVERNHKAIHNNDLNANDLDVLGNNEYIGWYIRRMADADSMDWI